MKWHLNITVKMLGYLLVVGAVPLALLGLTAYQISKRVVIEQAEGENARLLGSLSAYLKLYNDQVEDLAANIAGNETIGQALRRADGQNTNTFESLDARAQMGRILNSYVRVKGLVSIDLFSLQGEHFHVGETLNVTGVDPAQSRRFLDEALGSRTPTLWRGIDSNLNPGSPQKKVNSIVRAVQHFSPATGKTDTVGVLVVNLNDEILRAFLKGVPLGAGVQLMELDRGGNITLHSDAQRFGQPLTPALLDLVRAQPPVPQFALNGEDVLLNVSSDPAHQRWLAVITPRQLLTEKVNQLAMATFLLVGLGLLLILAMTWRFAHTVVSPIRAVSNGFRKLAKYPQSHHDALPPGPAHDEIGQLVQGYNDHLASLEAARLAAQELAQSEAELRAAESKVRENEIQLRTILDQMPVGVILVDTQERIFFRNRHFVELFGYGPDDVPDLQAWWLHAYPDAQYREKIQNLWKRAEVVAPDGSTTVLPEVYAVTAKTGEVRHIEISGVTTPSGFLATFVDHTQHQKHQHELEEAKALADQASEAKSGFLATMSHEIRTPMNGILGMLALLEHTELTSRQVDYITKAKGATQSLLGIINDILDFSKVEAGKIDLDLSPMSLAEVLRDLSVIVSANLDGKNVEVLIAMDADVPVNLVGDALRLRQVLLNLLGNAIKFTEQGEVLLSITVLRRDAGHAVLEFSVKDTGIGIPQDKLEYIFEGFSQAESSTTRRFGGTGLGLAISKRLVDLMGGKLTATSEMGQGSCFAFAVDFECLPEVPAAPIESPLPALRLLLVDANATARRVMEAMALGHGWSAQVLPSLDEMMLHLQQPETAPYDVILMDWRLPGMDGWDSVRRIRQIPACTGTPMVLMVSAQGRERLAQRPRRETSLVNGYLVKPVTGAMLKDVVLEATRAPGRAAKPQAVATGVQRLIGMRLLVVEDNALNQQIAMELLKRQGALVEIASGGIEGVDKAVASDPPFDAVLMDVQMPDIDGYEATRRIQSHARLLGLPVIAMTANALESDKAACLAAGMVDHVSKPINLQHLIEVLLQHAQPQHVPSAATVQLALGGGGDATPTPVLDVENAVVRLGGDRDFYGRLVQMFRGEAVSQWASLKVHAERGNSVQAQRDAHTLKGQAGTVGALLLAQACSVLEYSLQTQDRRLRKHLQSVSDALDATLADLSRIVPEASTPAVEAGSAGLTSAESLVFQQSLAELLDLLLRQNMRSLKVMDDIADRFGAAIGASLQPLAQSIARLDFASARVQCEALLDTVKSQEEALP